MTENVEKNPEIYVRSNNSIEKDLDHRQDFMTSHKKENFGNNKEHECTNAKSEDSKTLTKSVHIYINAHSKGSKYTLNRANKEDETHLRESKNWRTK